MPPPPSPALWALIAWPAPLAYSWGMALVPITVVEVEPFPSKAGRLWSEEERAEFITFIAHNPTAGDVIPASGGVRKVRWKRKGKGKRGGARVIYYFHDESMPLFLLTAYAKGRKEDLSQQEIRSMRRTVAELRSSHGND